MEIQNLHQEKKIPLLLLSRKYITVNDFLEQLYNMHLLKYVKIKRETLLVLAYLIATMDTIKTSTSNISRLHS